MLREFPKRYFCIVWRPDWHWQTRCWRSRSVSESIWKSKSERHSVWQSSWPHPPLSATTDWRLSMENLTLWLRWFLSQAQMMFVLSKDVPQESSPESIIRAVGDLLHQTKRLTNENHAFWRQLMFSGNHPTSAGEESLDQWPWSSPPND